MPEIARFYGIVIKLYFKDHNPPHFHAEYAECRGTFDIYTLEIIDGNLPKTAIELIKKWGSLHKEELSIMWDAQEFKKIKGLE